MKDKNKIDDFALISKRLDIEREYQKMWAAKDRRDTVTWLLEIILQSSFIVLCVVMSLGILIILFDVIKRGLL